MGTGTEGGVGRKRKLERKLGRGVAQRRMVPVDEPSIEENTKGTKHVQWQKRDSWDTEQYSTSSSTIRNSTYGILHTMKY